jgi:tetratricopeptide (TPR) repeat protein
MQRRATEIAIVVGAGVVVTIALALVLSRKHTPDTATDAGVPALDTSAQQLLELARSEVAAGNSLSAIETLTKARDLVIRLFGDRSPALAPFDDELAAAERARGNIRRALKLHDRSLALQPDSVSALLARARTKLEAGDVLEADRDVTQAKALITKAHGDMSPAYEIAADIADERGVPELAEQQRNSAHVIEPPDDTRLTVARARILARTADADQARRIASVVSDKSDPALALAAGEALLHAGDKAAAATLLSAAAKRLGNEPTRTALHIMIALAKASQDPQAARTAISLYQAMPKLDRTDYDAMWALAKAAAPE